MSDHDQPFFLKKNLGFGVATAADELLHTQQNSAVSADTLTETQYFGFCIPEEKIHGYCYLWHHQNLKVVSGGLFVYRGHKRSAVHGELCDYRDFMSDKALKDDLHDYRLDNGYGVKIVVPLEHQVVTYADAKRQSSIALDVRALAPPVMYGDSAHFEQPVQVTGELMLRGSRYAVDCYSMRDRSWGKARPEDLLPMPSLSWTQAVFSPDFSFCCSVLDQASQNTALANTPLAFPDEKTVNGGWIRRNGRVGRIVVATKRIVRHSESSVPLTIELDLTDEYGGKIQARGAVIASTTWLPWSNIFMPIVLMRWECEGMVAHGDCQEGIWNDYLQLRTELSHELF